jgi:hypothetical protein
LFYTCSLNESGVREVERMLARFEEALADDGPRYPAGQLALSLEVFADRARLRDEIVEDAFAAGFRLGVAGPVAALIEAHGTPGDVIVIDAPVAVAAALAALSSVDVRAARTGAQLVVSTSIAALDAVFGCLDHSGAQILVEPSRAERMIALGRVLAAAPRGRVRELSEDDRLALLRLTEQVGQLAERLERGGAPVFRFESPAAGWRGGGGDPSERLVRPPRPALPDPRLIRRIIRQRQLRARFFDPGLFADPAWDILLDLAAARAERKRVSVTSACIAAGVPPTTALRWIAQMTEAGLLERVEDESDRRRAFVALTARAVDAVARYFAEVGREAERLV